MNRPRHPAQPVEISFDAPPPRGPEIRRPIIRVVCPCCGVIISVNALDRQGETTNYCPKCEATVWIETEDDGAIVAINAQANEQKKVGEVPWRLVIAAGVVFLIFVFYLISLRATP